MPKKIKIPQISLLFLNVISFGCISWILFYTYILPLRIGINRMSRFDVRTLTLLSSVYPMWWFGELCWDYPPVKPSSRLLAHVPSISVSSWLFTPLLFTFLTHRFGHLVPWVVHVMFAILYLLVLPCSTPSSVELEPNRSGTGLFKDVVEKTPKVLTTPRSPLLRHWWYKCIYFSRMSQIVTKSWLWTVGAEDWHPHEEGQFSGYPG